MRRECAGAVSCGLWANGGDGCRKMAIWWVFRSWQFDGCPGVRLIARPASFDVILTENLFGDILTDEASMLAASLGMLPSASMGASGPGLFEPIHGSAPDIAGRKIANPIGTIWSTAMLLRLGLKLEAEALAVEQAVDRALKLGLRTADLSGAHSTEDATAMIISCLHAHRPSKTEESCA